MGRAIFPMPQYSTVPSYYHVLSASDFFVLVLFQRSTIADEATEDIL